MKSYFRRSSKILFREKLQESKILLIMSNFGTGMGKGAANPFARNANKLSLSLTGFDLYLPNGGDNSSVSSTVMMVEPC